MRDFDAKRNAFGGGGLVRRSGRAGVRDGGCHGVVFACASNSMRAHKDLALHASGRGWDDARNLGRNAWAKRGGEAVFFGKGFRFGTNEDVTSKLRLPLRVDDTLVARGTRRLTGSYRNEAVLAWKTEQPLRGV